MSREVRMVPPDWKHPEGKSLHGRSFTESLADWKLQKAKWDEGFVDDWHGGWKPKDEDYEEMTSEEWLGHEPEAHDYMPEWPAGIATHLMMYETTSEGGPISPAFATPEELARWLADNGASAFGRDTATYDQWLNTIKRGWAPSGIFTAADTKIRSGVEALARDEGINT